MSTPNVTYLHPARAVTNLCDPRFHGDSPFWSAALGVGVNVIVSQIGDVDALSRRIGTLPPRSDPRRALVGAYLGMMQLLAAAWLQRTRPALLVALRSIHAYTEQLLTHEAPLLSDALAPAGLARDEAARLVNTLITRLDLAVHALESIDRDFGGYLTHMAGASGELETDTVLVTQRLQADHVHASILARQVSTIQDRLDQARLRQHGHWPLGPQAEQLRREVAAQSAALDCTRRQVEQIRAEQVATLAEATFLQQLLPTLSSYLAGVDRMGAGIRATLSGTQALQAQLGELTEAMQGDGASVLLAQGQLAAALPHWRNLAARLNELGQGG